MSLRSSQTGQYPATGSVFCGIGHSFSGPQRNWTILKKYIAVIRPNKILIVEESRLSVSAYQEKELAAFMDTMFTVKSGKKLLGKYYCLWLYLQWRCTTQLDQGACPSVDGISEDHLTTSVRFMVYYNCACKNVLTVTIFVKYYDTMKYWSQSS